MENNVKFALALATLDKKIANLNIEISKDFDNQKLKDELSILLNDRETLLKERNIPDALKLKSGRSVKVASLPRSMGSFPPNNPLFLSSLIFESS